MPEDLMDTPPYEDPFYDHLLSDDSDEASSWPTSPVDSLQADLQRKDQQIEALKSELKHMTFQLQDQGHFVSQTLIRVNQILQHFTTLQTSVQDLKKSQQPKQVSKQLFH